MNGLYQQVLDGTAASNPTGDNYNVLVNNKLPIPLLGYRLTSNGQRQLIGQVDGGADVTYIDIQAGDIIVWTNAYSGAFFMAANMNAGWTGINLGPKWFVEPNDIGRIPQPFTDRPIPPNSPSVLVSCGEVTGDNGDNNGNCITREQYWEVQGDSYALTPGEARETSYTITSGRQATSSAEASVSSSVGASAGAGWGAASASINASLNVSASVSQQVTVSTERSTYVSDRVTNDTSEPVMVLRWQLMDVVTVYANAGIPLSNVTHALSPIIPLTYDLTALEGLSPRPSAVSEKTVTQSST
ncbi:MAG: hypothetical protein ACPGGK_01205 [Pikeienuella sp.]